MTEQPLVWHGADGLPDAGRQALLGAGAPFELTTGDVLGAEMEIFATRTRSIPGLLAGAVQRFGDAPYVAFTDASYTYASIVDPVARVAGALRDEYGIGTGDRVAIVAANTREWVLTFWAATCLGAVTVAFNGWWTGPEIEYGLELTTPSILLGDKRRIDRLAARPADIPTVVFEEGFPDDHVPIDDLFSVPMAEDDPYLILFTSGTTGRPKGAVISHRSNIHFIQASLLNAAAGSLAAGVRPAAPPRQPCTINASPLFHLSGLNCQLVMACATGMRIVYPPPGRWQEDVHLGLTQEHGATSWSLVPTQLWRLLQWPSLGSYDLSSLASVGGGSAVWAPELLRTLEEKLPHVRPALGTGYGSTETNGLGTTLRPAASYLHPDSIGSACPAAAIRIGDADDDGIGEICIRTAAGFLGYWENPSATASALDADRWYHTGDIGKIVDGFVYLAGRRRDLIIRGGENIYPAEIENRILEHHCVSEVAVIGVEDPIMGQEVKAVVVAHSPVTDSEIRDWCASALAAFKVPTVVDIVESLPHNASGKVLKHLLENPSADAGFIEE